MFTASNIPSTSSILAMYSTFAAAAMLVRTILNELIPQWLQVKILSIFGQFFTNPTTQMTLFIKEHANMELNELYQASEVYLSTRITSSIGQLQVSKAPREKSLSIKVNRGQQVLDTFRGMDLVWEFVTTETQQIIVNYEDMSGSNGKTEHKSVTLSFHKRYKDELNNYLPYVMETFKCMESEKRSVRLYAYGSVTAQYYEGPWGSINLDHPSTFDTLAMEPELKREIMEDLDRFVKRKDFYRRVGKAWKRGYLLYGPPGTGKSSLVAAMANYLKFDIYDLELASVQGNGGLRSLLTGTANRSIVVIEDIDCSAQLQDRGDAGYDHGSQNQSILYTLQVTLSGLLTFIDGLWSSCGDERIIVFTTNHKDRLDPALLRPGRMDMHIHMSYCSPNGFRILASNYLQIENHRLFDEIERLIKELEVTPAEIAEELMKGGDVDDVLEGLVGFLEKKREKQMELLDESGSGKDEGMETVETGSKGVEEKAEMEIVS
ncbi:unnamed protein product [Linum tenue]|uniref:AAA+ ATPase domain-containing protein n=1 Tax=Linum tenue TaxID=586396 RepID=A0AAV0H991_9ROSI|nr:unnamed protein product [Linum tenue]